MTPTRSGKSEKKLKEYENNEKERRRAEEHVDEWESRRKKLQARQERLGLRPFERGVRGMTQEQVVETVGSPTRKEKNAWIYVQSHTVTDKAERTRAFRIEFADGLVTSKKQVLRNAVRNEGD